MMKKRNLLFGLLILALFVAVSCSGAKKKSEKLVTDAGVFPRYLELIPEDTPFVLASLEPLPEQIVDVLLEKFRPMGESFKDNPMVKHVPFFEVLNEEVIQKLIQPKGFESLGMVKSPMFVVYGIGVSPAVRIQIADGKKVRELFKRIEKRMGIKADVEKIGDQELWSYSEDKVVFPFAIVGDELVFGVTHQNAGELFTNYLLGIKKPVNSFAKKNKIEQVAAEYGFLKYMVGFVNFEEIFKSVFTESSSLNSQIAALIPDFRIDSDPICVSEWMSLVSQAPRLVFGYDVFKGNLTVARFGLEVNNGLPSEVLSTKTSTSLSTAKVDGTKFMASVGFDVGKIVDIVRSRISKLQNEPFQCNKGITQKLNEASIQAPMLAMIPPAILEIKGASLGFRDLEHVDVSNGDPNVWPQYKNYLDAFLFVRSDNPRNLFDVISLALPEFAALKIKDDLVPVELTLPSHMSEFRKPSVMLSKQHLGLTSGLTTSTDLGKVLKDEHDNPASPFAIMKYDTKAIIDMIQNASNQSPQEKKVFESFEIVFKGDSTVEFYPEERGFFIKVTQPL